LFESGGTDGELARGENRDGRKKRPLTRMKSEGKHLPSARGKKRGKKMVGVKRIEEQKT